MVFDGHCDIPYDILKRQICGESNIFDSVFYRDFKKSKIKNSIFAICADNKSTADKMLNVFLKDCENSKYLDVSQLRKKKIGGILQLEGIGFLNSPEEIIEYIDKGVKVFSLTWNEKNKFAGGAKSDGDLTDSGKEIINVIAGHNLVLDVSHLNDRSLYSVLKFTDIPVVATHSSIKAICNNHRNLSNEFIKEIANRGGIIGINSYPDFISKNRENQTVKMLAEHILYAINLVGPDFVGLGLDLCYFEDGNYNKTLKDLKNYGDVHKVLKELKKYGLSEPETKKIAYSNWHRVLKNHKILL